MNRENKTPDHVRDQMILMEMAGGFVLPGQIRGVIQFL